MSIERDPHTKQRVLRFVATSAVVVAPISFVACGGATPEATNVDHEPNTNVAPEETMNVAPEETNVDHTDEPHTNVGPEGDDEGEEGGDDEESPE
ncbi:MAG: hypothetical protein RIF41_06750 [Polyangiaceae bacterium]